MLPSLNQGVPRQIFSLLLLKRQRTVSNKKKKKKRNKTTHRTKMPGSYRQTLFCSWKGTKISAEGDVDSHVSRLKPEKALKSVLREMPSGTFLLGKLNNSGWTVIDRFQVSHFRPVVMEIEIGGRSEKSLGGQESAAVDQECMGSNASSCSFALSFPIRLPFFVGTCLMSGAVNSL